MELRKSRCPSPQSLIYGIATNGGNQGLYRQTPTREKGDQLLKDFQDLQKGKELLQRFPPDKFGPQTLKDMADMAFRKQPVPLEYREFADPEVQKLWNKALKAQQDAQASEKKEAEKKEKVEEKKQ